MPTRYYMVVLKPEFKNIPQKDDMRSLGSPLGQKTQEFLDALAGRFRGILRKMKIGYYEDVGVIAYDHPFFFR